MSPQPSSNGGEGVGKQGHGSMQPTRQHNYPGQDLAFRFYNSTHVQVFVAFLIVANFLTNVTEKQIDPSGEHYTSTWDAFDWFYNIVFLIELLANLYAHWFFEFWESNWNIFDTIVVTIGVINMLNLPLPEAFSMLRCMRAFRIFRLFRRVKSLNKIIVAMLTAVPGVCNAFVILTIVMAIYSILGVEFFRNVGSFCHEDPSRTGRSQEEHDKYITGRTFCVGKEYYGTFFRSMYTQFQVLTGESWSEAIARPIIWSYEDGFYAFATVFYYVSFILLTAFVLVNVVVAVLLDKMQANEGLSSSELEMLATYEKTGQSLSKLAEKAKSMQESLQALKVDMATMKEQFNEKKGQI
mmetsp:Transcript_48459/g.75503  ORF Transcript_48459/g.75503 Transcript_48459/m.75503 type:complete len:353 (+) Transcript_48459:126-1184(+)